MTEQQRLQDIQDQRLPAKIKINGFEPSEIKIGETAHPDSNIDEFNGLPCEWSSSDDKVAEVDEDGAVTGNSIGTAEITASVLGEITGEGTIEVVEESVELEEEQEESAGKSLKLKAKVTATKKANKKLKWKSSNVKYAKVSSSGKVKTLKAGKGKKVKITAMATHGSGKKKSITVKLK